MRKLDRLTHYADLNNGELVMHNRRWFRGMLQQYENCPVVVVVERRRNSRSKEQLGYLWGVVYPLIAEHTGHSKEDLHEIFKAKYLQNHISWRGSEMIVAGSTTRLSANEMAEFITNVIVEANELEIEVPDPDPLYQFNDVVINTDTEEGG